MISAPCGRLGARTLNTVPLRLRMQLRYAPRAPPLCQSVFSKDIAHRPPDMPQSSAPSTPLFDYIIVGAGSAGCVLANRLSEDGKHSVLLLEAGGSDQHIMVKMPTALSYPMAMKAYNWGFLSAPEPALGGRQITCPRGRGLGGSSSINGMVYVRGTAGDYADWEAAGAAGWGYKDNLPYFKRAETWVKGENDYRGGGGPLAVCAGNDMALNPLYQAFIDAGVDAGYPFTEDYNGYNPEGFGPMHMTVDKGVRASTAHAYLRPAQSRSNLSVLKHVLIDKVLLDGKRAVGVEGTRGGRPVAYHAAREVILAAGSIASPAILERSGIGEPDALEAAGVPLTHALPGVGNGLQDHLEVYFQFHCKQPVSLNDKLDLWSKFWIGARWFFFRSGLGATNHFESCAFIRSRAGLQHPDIQYHFLPAAMRYDGTPSLDGHGFQVHVGPNKPKSRGATHIVSPRPDDAPDILFNYLQHEDDVRDWRACIRLTREIIGQPAMDAFRGQELQPGVHIQTDDEIDAWVKDNVESAYHPAGTAVMGPTDAATSVVDPECRVIGLEALRVVDASVIPALPYGNINAPVIMIAEKASDMILGRPLLPAADVDTWFDEDWQTRQRPGVPKRSAS